MRRRELVALLAGTGLAWPVLARAQVSRPRPLLGYIAGGKRAVVADLVSAFQEGLRELGHVEGRDIDIVYRFAEAQPELLPGLAGELVQLNPSVVLAGAVDSAVAMRNVTRTITPYVTGLPAKQIELAREIVPAATAVGLLGNMNDPKAGPQREEIEAAGRTLGVKVVAADVHGAGDISGAIQGLAAEGIGVLIVLQTTMLLSERKQIAAAAAASALPAVYGYRQHVVDGGLVSYGVDLRWCFHRAATFVHKILGGAVPGDLPVEFPTKIEMLVNLKTAQALGITLPRMLLARADEIIE